MEKKSAPGTFTNIFLRQPVFFVDFNDWNPHLPGTITPKTVQGYPLRSSEHVSESAISLMDENIFFGIPVPKGGSLAAWKKSEEGVGLVFFLEMEKYDIFRYI